MQHTKGLPGHTVPPLFHLKRPCRAVPPPWPLFPQFSSVSLPSVSSLPFRHFSFSFAKLCHNCSTTSSTMTPPTFIDIIWRKRNTEMIEMWGEKPPKTVAPPYSPNPWAESVKFLARDPSCEYFRGHRGDFSISFWKLRYGPIYRVLRAKINISASRMKFKNRLGAP